MKQKNILFIITDQQRKDSLGCYGNTIVNTPNIDKLASRGVVFDRYYCSNPICMPNRLSIFTGMNPRNHGVWTNGLLREQELRTMATELHDNGYNTASFGKIHFTPWEGNGGNKESFTFWKENTDLDWNGPYWGFQHVELTIGHTDVAAHYGKWFKENGGTPDMMTIHSLDNKNEVVETAPIGSKDYAIKADASGIRHMPSELHDSAFVADRTIAYLESKKEEDNPFFIVASFPDPHLPFNPPEEYAQKYPVSEINEPIGCEADLKTRPDHYQQYFRGGWHRKGIVPERHPSGIDDTTTRTRIALTYAMTELIDYNIGRIVDTLKQMDLMEDTIIVFTSDHGELLGDHGLWSKGPFYYEGLVNIPLIIYAQDSLKQGRSKSLVSSIDILPTLFDMVDIPVPEYVNGISHRDHIIDGDSGKRDACLVEYRNGFGPADCSSMALITDRYKYIHYQNGERELTDLMNDPGETVNHAGSISYKEIEEELRNCLLEEVLASGSNLPCQIGHA